MNTHIYMSMALDYVAVARDSDILKVLKYLKDNPIGDPQGVLDELHDSCEQALIKRALEVREGIVYYVTDPSVRLYVGEELSTDKVRGDNAPEYWNLPYRELYVRGVGRTYNTKWIALHTCKSKRELKKISNRYKWLRSKFLEYING